MKELLLMNGHGVYVWTTYAIFSILVIALTLRPFFLRSRLRKKILQHEDSE
ncbi:MAG: heme exporter protein CcmD [Gammaproteobacteria bacterium]|nr:heme exporter protein CcmD [Gammaproteobacteria bacterium]